MSSVEHPSSIFTALNMLSRVCDSTLDHWLSRIQAAAEQGGYPLHDFTPFFLEDHRERLFDLIRKATPLPDVQTKAAALVMHMDPVMRAGGHYREWVEVARGLAVAMCVRGIDHPLLLADLWRAVGRCYRHLGEEKRAVRAFRIAELFASGQGEASEDFQAELRQELAGVRVTQMRFDEAEAAALDLLAAACERGDYYTLTLGHNLLAYAYLRDTQFEAAFAQAQQALELARALPHELLEAQALHYMAESCRLAHRLDQAEHYLTLARVRVEALDDKNWLALLDQSMGGLLVERQQYAEAVDHLRRAWALFKDMRDARNAANCGQALGLALGRAGDYDAAVDMLVETVAAWKQLDSALEAADTYYTLGWVYRWAGFPERSRQAFAESWQLVAGAAIEGTRCEHLRRNLCDELGLPLADVSD